MASVLGVLLLVGTLWDEQISQMLYDPSSWFGIVFAAYGEVPVVMALATGGTMLIRARSRHRLAVTIGHGTSAGALLVLSAAIAVVMPARYLDIHILLLTGIGVLLIAGSVLFARWLARGAERKATASVAVIIVVVVLVEL